MERSEFRLKMDQFKQARASNPLLSYWEWKNSLPDNLANTPDWLYNNIGAWSGGLQPELGDDGYYHLEGTELKSYMNTLRSYMLSIGLMDRPGLKVTTKTIKRAINSLPSEMNAVRAAYLQFDSPGKYTKWFNKIPLLGIPGAAMYLENKNESN